MRSVAAALFLLLLSTVVGLAQSSVGVIGVVTPGHCVSFFSTTQIQDAGGICGVSGGGVNSVTGTAGQITVTPTTGNPIVSLPAIITENLTFSGTHTLQNLLTIAVTGGGTQCLQVNNTGVVSGTGVPCGSGSGAVTSVTGTAGQITVAPTTGAVVVSLPATITSNETFSGLITLTNTLTTNVTGGGTQCLQVSNTGVLSGAGASCATVAVTSVNGTAGQITVTPTTGAVVVSLPATITSNETFSGTHTLTNTLTIAVTGGGTQCLQASNTGVVSGTGTGCAAAAPVTSVSGTAGQIAVAPTTGTVVVSLPATITASLTFSGTVTLTNTLTTNVTGGGVQCLQASNTGVVSGTGGPCGSGSGAVTSVTGTAGQITVAPTTGAVVVGLPATITANLTFSGTHTLTNTLTINVTGSTQCLQASSLGVVSGTGSACGGSGAPGGSSGQLQYNAAGSFGGIAGATTNGTVVTFGNSDIALLGSSTGATTFASANAGASNFTLTFPALTDTIVTLTATQTLTGKTFDTAGSGNVLKINGTQLTAVQGNTAVVQLANITGATSGHCLQFDASLNVQDAGGVCTTGGGSGTVTSGTAGQLAWYAANGNTVVGNANATMSSGTLTLGQASSVLGQVKFSGSGSGVIAVTAPVTAGSGTITLPVTGADTFAVLGTAQTFTATETFAPPAASLTQGFVETQSLSGTVATNCSNATLHAIGSDFPCANNFAITSDVANSSALNNYTGWFFSQSVGGAALQGARETVVNALTFTAATSASNSNRNYVAHEAVTMVAASDGGTGTTLALAKGNFFAMNAVVLANSSATNLNGLAGLEIDIQCSSCTTFSRFGLWVVTLGTTQAASLPQDAAIALGNSNTGGGWHNGFLLTNVGTSFTPLDTGGCVICTDGSADTIATGMDLSSYTISGNFLRGPSFTVSGAGTITAGTWNGGVVGPTYGGTGVNNGASTITLAGNLTHAGAFATTITATATTNSTLPAGTHTLAALDLADQTMSGGVNLTAHAYTTGNITVDCGFNPVQFVSNNAAFTITAPLNDGTCLLQVRNTASAGAITFSGFTAEASHGDPITTVNGSVFVLSIWRVTDVGGAKASYRVAALQ